MKEQSFSRQFRNDTKGLSMPKKQDAKLQTHHRSKYVAPSQQFSDWATARAKEKYLKSTAGKNWLKKYQCEVFPLRA